MRVFISADIEGTAFTTLWPETELGEGLYPAAARQMTLEVKAACEGAIAAGADYILVNDAHDHAVNIDVSQLPECVEVIRGWTGNPLGMVDGVDSTFDAVMFVGYHSAWAIRCPTRIPLRPPRSSSTASRARSSCCSAGRALSWASPPSFSPGTKCSPRTARVSTPSSTPWR